MVPHWFGTTGSELVNNRYYLADFLGGRQLLEQIAEEPLFIKRTELFVKSFVNGETDCLDFSSSRLLAALLHIILSRRGNVQIRELEEETGYSARYIDKVFHGYVGVSPKEYCRFIRFQTMLSRVNKYGGGALMDLAMDSGYYDHSHMLRDFKAFTTLNPQQYMREIDLPMYRRKIIDLAIEG
jgi:AraC-like DNA-binding protein